MTGRYVICAWNVLVNRDLSVLIYLIVSLSPFVMKIYDDSYIFELLSSLYAFDLDFI